MSGNVQIFSLPRCGSKYLMFVLQQSPAILHRFSEPFNHKKVKDLDVDYSEACKKRWEDIQRKGSGILVKQIHHSLYDGKALHPDVRRVHEEFESHTKANYYTVKLIRRDFFEHLLSYSIACQNDVWQLTLGDTLEPLEVDEGLFRRAYEELKIRRQFLEEYPFFQKTVYYEDLTLDPREDWRLFPELPQPQRFEKLMTFQSPPKRETVLNYEHLYDLFCRWQDSFVGVPAQVAE